MTQFVHVDMPKSHPGVARFESTVAHATAFKRNISSSRSLAGMLLTAMVAALMVVADQLIDTWADGHLLAAWVLMWVMAFTAMAFLAPAARRLASFLVARLDVWSAKVAQRRADARLWAIAQKDARMMKDIMAARRD
jgi:hypothetical protein